ncbi:hypothetical protein GCM10017688_28730 [Streptomyces ramulosus]
MRRGYREAARTRRAGPRAGAARTVRRRGATHRHRTGHRAAPPRTPPPRGGRYAASASASAIAAQRAFASSIFRP